MMCKDHTRMIEAACTHETGTFDRAGTSTPTPLVDNVHHKGCFPGDRCALHITIFLILPIFVRVCACAGVHAQGAHARTHTHRPPTRKQNLAQTHRIARKIYGAACNY